MSAQIDNLIRQTTTGTGTGNLTLSAVTGGYQTFNGAFGNGATTNVFYYSIFHTTSTEWEVGTGHMSDATTLVRDTVLKSSNSNSAVSFSSGSKNVVCDIAAQYQARINAQNTFAGGQLLSLSTLTDGATITPDFSLNNSFIVLLGGNRTLANPTNLIVGVTEAFSIDIIQDATGSRTLAYDWGYNFAGGTAPTLSTPGATRDTLYGTVKTYNSGTVTITIANPGVVSFTAHGFYTGQKIQITTTGALPTGLTASTTYFVIKVDANSFQLATSLTNAAAGTAINTTGSQSGVHTLTGLTINANLVKAFA